MPLESRNLQTGTVLRARYKGKERTCDVVQTADGLHYRLDDGREFASPSSAGKAAMDGIACNGWRFWSIGGTEKPKRGPMADKPARAKKEPAAKKPAKPKAAPKKSAKTKRAKQGKAMRAASKSNAVYGCGACGETFPTMKAATQHATQAHLS
jgi:hypothetical protein